MKENKSYEKFKDSINFTGLMNLLRLHYIISRDFGSERVDMMIDSLKEILVSMKVEDLKAASRFRGKHVKKKFNYIDCLGYSAALNRKLKFVTGDKEFKDLKNVESIK